MSKYRTIAHRDLGEKRMPFGSEQIMPNLEGRRLTLEKRVVYREEDRRMLDNLGYQG